MSVPVTLSDLERWDAKGQTSLEHLQNYAPTVWPRTTKFVVVTLVQRGVLPGVSHAPMLRGGFQRPQIFGTPTYAYMAWPRATKFCMVTHLRKSVRGSASPQISGCGSPASPKFLEPLTCAHIAWETAIEFRMKIKLDVRIILYGRPCRLPWPKCLVTGMLMHDLLAVAKKKSYLCYSCYSTHYFHGGCDFSVYQCVNILENLNTGTDSRPDKRMGSWCSFFRTWSLSPVRELSSTFKSFDWIITPSAGSKSPTDQDHHFA